MKTITLLIALIILLPAGAWAADPTIELNQAMDQAGFSTTQAAQVQSIIDTARRSGVPAEAVRSKVYEGMAKQIDPDRIITAMQRVTSRYEYSYTLARKLTPNSSQAAKLGNTLTAGIAAGLTRRDANRLVNNLQTRAQQIDSKKLYQLAEESMRTARDMSRQGVSSATTADVIGKAVQKGYAARDMQAMRSTFSKQAAQGNRESLARDYGAAIGRGVQANDLSGIGTGSG